MLIIFTKAIPELKSPPGEFICKTIAFRIGKARPTILFCIAILSSKKAMQIETEIVTHSEYAYFLSMYIFW